MRRVPDPDLQSVLPCQTCGDVVVRYGEEISIAVWATRTRSMTPDVKELLCVNCAIKEVEEQYDIGFDEAQNIVFASISDGDAAPVDGGRAA